MDHLQPAISRSIAVNHTPRSLSGGLLDILVKKQQFLHNLFEHMQFKPNSILLNWCSPCKGIKWQGVAELANWAIHSYRLANTL